ncbi:hypothetical protein [Holdemania filiformis]|uniref:hypothetical protein n=1 Tax=Holdemania filiformis TaxID=61171 RepID=UPI00030D5925
MFRADLLVKFKENDGGLSEKDCGSWQIPSCFRKFGVLAANNLFILTADLNREISET